MHSVRLTDRVYWVGVKDPDLRLFDINVKTEYGTTYNSYLVLGDKKALIDTVKFGFEEDFFAKIEEHLPVDQIDYLIINHTEPDHSGALSFLLKRNPKIKILCSKPALPFLHNLLNDNSFAIETVKEGDRLELGGATLEFISAPFVHWPDTMFTYLAEEKILFPCDGYAAHYSPYEDMFFQAGDQVVDHAAWYYYDCIMRPYASFCRKATQAAMKLDINICAPSHGPINNIEPKRFIEKYLEWTDISKPSEKPFVAVAYASAYGNTRKLAVHLAQVLQRGDIDTRVIDVVETSTQIKRDLFEAADGILFGSPTFVNDVVKPMWETLILLPTISCAGKKAAVFGSYGWSGQAINVMEVYLQNLKLRLYQPGMKTRLVPSQADLDHSTVFAEGFLKFLQE